MRRLRLAFYLAATLLFVTGRADADGQFILRARSSADAETLRQRYGLTGMKVVRQTGTDEICVVRAATQSAAEEAALKDLVVSDSLAVSFEVDSSLKLAETSAPPTGSAAGLAQSTAAILESFAGKSPVPYFNGLVAPGYLGQPAAGLIRLSSAQQIATGGGIVALVDTGVDPSHPALAGVLVPGYDFINGVAGVPDDFGEITQSTAAILEQLAGSSPDSVALLNQSTAAILEQSTAAILEAAQLPPAFGHATMVAGLIHLVAPTAQIMPLKAFRSDGTAAMSDLVAAIYYAVDHGATVVNMSFTLTAPSQSLLDAITYAASKKVLLVAAAGNDASQAATYPASWRGVLSVAATTMTDTRSAFTNYGSVDLCAPGEALITAYPGNHYAAVWGTSFATALVTGSVALIQQYLPRTSESTAMRILEHGAEVNHELGDARIDAYRALQYMLHEYFN